MTCSSTALAFLLGLATIGWAAVVIVLLVAVLIALCGIEIVDEHADGRERRFRIRRFQDRR